MDPDIEFFYPVVTRRPVVERELEFKVEYKKTREGRSTELAAALEWAILPRFQVEVEFPLLILDPHEGPTIGGIGDIEVDNKVLLYKPGVHTHRHVHDAHHQHPHQDWEGPEPHVHPHPTGPLAHAHAHRPDIHHGHDHRSGGA